VEQVLSCPQVRGAKIVLFHYPLLSLDGSHRENIHFYGHAHNSGERDSEFGEKQRLFGSRAINIGVDVNEFYPVNIKVIINKVKMGK